MVVSICSIHDKLVGYGKLFTELNDAVAIRSFSEAVSDGYVSAELGYTPSDLSLYSFGSFDTDTGKIDLLPTPLLLVDGANVVLSAQLQQVKGGVDNE